MGRCVRSARAHCRRGRAAPARAKIDASPARRVCGGAGRELGREDDLWAWAWAARSHECATTCLWCPAGQSRDGSAFSTSMVACDRGLGSASTVTRGDGRGGVLAASVGATGAPALAPELARRRRRRCRNGHGGTCCGVPLDGGRRRRGAHGSVPRPLGGRRRAEEPAACGAAPVPATAGTRTRRGRRARARRSWRGRRLALNRPTCPSSSSPSSSTTFLAHDIARRPGGKALKLAASRVR